MRRILVVICALSLAAAGAARADTRLQANQAAARRDARELLASLRLPRGVTRVVTEPRFARPLWGDSGPSRRYNASDTAWWTTDVNPQTIIAYVKAHRPAGASVESTGSGGDYRTGTTSLEAVFSWPPIGQAVFGRMLTVSTITSPHGGSAIVARSQSSWMVPRSRSERVPSGVRDVDVTLRIGSGHGGMKHQRTHTYRVFRPARVTSIISMLDGLPIVQPGVVYSCAAMFPHMPLLTLRFLAAGGRTLGRAQVNVYPGSHGASGWNECDPIDFWIGGKPQTPLTSQTFVKWIGGLIGANIS